MVADRNSRSKFDSKSKFEERVLLIKRVSKKTSGGNYVTFTALVAVGDGDGSIGVGKGSAVEVPPAIKKAISYAKKHIFKVNRYKTTIPHEVCLSYKSSKILLKPAPEGAGLKVGSVMRTLLELAGVKDASGKILGSRNQTLNSHAVVKALKKLKVKDEK